MNKKIKYTTLIILFLISIYNIYNAKFLLIEYEPFFLKTLIIIIVSIISAILYKKYILKVNPLIIYVIGNILLILLLLFGKKINGSTSWINIGFINIQPSEIMKIPLIILGYQVLEKHYTNIKYFIILTIIFIIPSILVFLEPDTGSIIIYILIYLFFINKININKKNKILIICLFIISSAIIFLNFKSTIYKIIGDYRLSRLREFTLMDGYQITNALESIRNSSLFGIKTYHYYPEAITDFAFTFLINNIGLLGIIVFLIIYFSLIVVMYKNETNHIITYTILSEVVINIFMNLGLIPIVGITFPLLSYGGSSFVTHLILININEGDNNYMNYNNYTHKAHKNMEHN